MAEIEKSYRFDTHQLSEDEMARQFLEQSIRTLGYKLRKACDSNDQREIEKIYDMLTKARRVLSKLRAGPVTS